MARYLTKYQFAKNLKLTPPSITGAIQRGSVKERSDGRIDTKDSVNIKYAKDALNRQRRKKYNTQSLSRKERKELIKNGFENIEEQLDTIDDEEVDGDEKVSKQKKEQEVRKLRAQADKLSLEYADRLKVFMDDETLNRVFGMFADHLLNDLIYFPDEISDMLVAEITSNENPEKICREILKKRIADIIKKAKVAADKINSPKKGIIYSLKKGVLDATKKSA